MDCDNVAHTEINRIVDTRILDEYERETKNIVLLPTNVDLDKYITLYCSIAY